jgi:lysophospholipase L1-like esterase
MRRLLVLALITTACARPPARVAGPTRILVLGDSVAHGAGDESGRGLAADIDRELARLGIAHDAVIDAAINGSRTWQLASAVVQPRVRELVARADAIVVSIGGNDLYGDSRARMLSMLAPQLRMDVVVDRITSIVHTLERRSRARVVLLGLYDPYGHKLDPYVSLWSAKLFDRFARDPRVTVVTIADLFSARSRLSPVDHFHPGGMAYEAIARRVVEAL